MALTEEQLRKLPQPAQNYWRAAFKFVTDPENWFLLDKNTPTEMTAWRNYFQTKGWEPFMMRQIRQRKLDNCLVPAQWPEWFDGEYTVVEGIEFQR